MLRKLLALIVMFGLFGFTIGCEAEGRVDDDNGKVELEIDD